MAIKKRRAFISFEKEEQWLNDMAAKGLNFVSYKFMQYTFEEGTPGEYIYRLELLGQAPEDEKSQDYLQFMEENGIECVDTYMDWVFFRKKAADGPFEIYSDGHSKIAHYTRVATLFGIIGMVNLVIAFFNLMLTEVNMYLSIVNFLVVVIFTPLFISYVRKIRVLRKEQALYDR